EDFTDICVANTLPRTPSSLLAHAEEAKLLVVALRKLSLAQQIVLELNAFEGLRGPEIATLLGTPVATVYTHLRRGRLRLDTLVRQLTNDPKLAHSTLTNLEGWALAIRKKVDEVTGEEKTEDASE
ncbi:MAG: sigma factor-like helix-turn-helix DNA-binding protein, partial [Nannocystaceae bacterium]